MGSHLSKTKTSEDPRSRFSAAFERVRAEIAAVPASALITINIDVAHAVTTVLGVLPALQEHRESLQQMPGFDIKKLDRLEDYAFAVLDAHSARKIDPAPDARLPELHQEGAALRALLVHDAQTLANRRLIDPKRLGDVKQGAGYESLAIDLLSLSKLFREAWPSVQGRLATTRAEIDRADALATALALEVGARNTTLSAVSETIVTRRKAFTLMVNAYSEVRVALAYLRRKDGDVETLIPSLYASRAKPRRKGDSTPPPPGELAAASGLPSALLTPTPPHAFPVTEDGE
jgi:hypothetical protein